MSEKAVSNLAVLTFEGQGSAEAVYEQIKQMEKEKLVVLDDAVILECTSAAAHVHTMPGETASAHMAAPPMSSQGVEVRVKQTQGKKGKYAAVGGGLGLLAGALLGGPVGLIAVGAASVGAITAAMKDFGIDDKTVEAIKQRMQPNTSALMLLGHANDRDALLAKLREYDAQVAMTSLDPDTEKELIARLEASS